MKYLLFIFISVSFTLNAQFNKDSLYSYQELNKMLEIAKTDQKTLARIYVQLGDYEGDKFAQYEKSLEYYTRALVYFKNQGDSVGVHETQHSIARRYIEAGFYPEAINLLNDLAKYAQNQKDIRNVANIYFDLNRAYKARGDYENSISYLEKSIEINRQLNDTILFTKIMFDKIQTFELNSDLDSALSAAFHILKISTQLNNAEMAAKSLFHIGYVNKLKKDYTKALKYLNKSEKLLPFQSYSENRKNIYKEMADVYFLSSQEGEAYQYLRKYTMLNDSILNKNRLESFTNLALKYGTKEKQTSIEILKLDKQIAEDRNKAQRTTLYILAGGLLLVLGSIYFIIKFYDQRISTTKIITQQVEEINQQKIRELEDNIKISSMLSVIEGQEIERERIAKDLHDSLGGLLSTIKLQFDQVWSKKQELGQLKEYNQAHKLLDTAVEEVRNISRNLQPGSLHDLGLIPAIKDLINRFEGDGYPDIDFQYYEMPDKIDKMISLSIYRIIQELMANTLKHAQAHEILIQINKDSDDMVIQYEDDGIGFDQGNLKRKGMGLENIKSRINYLHGNVVIDSKSNEGMSVLIRVPFQ